MSTPNEAEYFDRLEAPTAVRDELRARVPEEVINLPRGATFTPGGRGSVQFDFSITSSGTHRERNKVVGYLDIKVYGEMSYGDRRDKAATVEIRRHPDGRVVSWTRSNAWDGHKFKDMPDGARQNVANAVVALLGEIDWKALADELQLFNHAREHNQAVIDAEHSLYVARSLAAQGPKLYPLSPKQ